MKISVITPSLNQRNYLAQTLRSVLSQRGPFTLQYVIIDGGSTDGTLELLASITDPRLRWMSEPDRGQASAINKGLTLADGDVVAWLNADDLYAEDALAGVARAFGDHSDAQWLVGRCDIIDAHGNEIRRPVTRYKDRALRRYTYRALLRENMISQPAVFWRRSFGDRVGRLDESLHYTMDYDLWLRMGRCAAPLILSELLAHFRLHRASKSGRVDRRQFDEQYRVARPYLGADWRSHIVHRLNVEKIVWAYRLMKILGR